MANDNETVLNDQQSAMATDAATDTADGGEVKVRKTPYYNAYQSAINLIDYVPGEKEDKDLAGLMQKWTLEEPEGEVRSAVMSVLETLRTKFVALRDEPRDEENVPGRHYVGILPDGSRQYFKVAGTPNEKSAVCANFKIVLGPMHTRGGAEFVEKHGRGSDTPLVFHRKGTPDNLGRTSVKKSFR